MSLLVSEAMPLFTALQAFIAPDAWSLDRMGITRMLGHMGIILMLGRTGIILVLIGTTADIS
jgi:hypothetical protein